MANGDRLDFYGNPVNPGTVCTVAEGKTVQSEAAQADINKILKRFESSGILPVTGREGMFLDTTEIADFGQQVLRVAQAKDYFDRLPAEVRSEFNNDVVVFMGVVANPSPTDIDRLVEIGVYDRESVPEGGAGAPPSGAAPS